MNKHERARSPIDVWPLETELRLAWCALLFVACAPPARREPSTDARSVWAKEDAAMTDGCLTLHLDVPGGSVSAGFEDDGWCYARTTAPFRGVDHVGFYRAQLPAERVVKLRRLFAEAGPTRAGATLSPEEPSAVFGDERGEVVLSTAIFSLLELTPAQRAALEAASALVEELFDHPVTALSATGSLAATSIGSSGPLRFSARFQNLGVETVRWLHAPSALGGGKGRAGLEILELAPGVDSDAQRAASAELAARALRLTKLDGSAVEASPEVSTEPGDALVLWGECALRLEPGRYRAILHVQLGEPADADGSCTFGLWNIDLGEFEVQP